MKREQFLESKQLKLTLLSTQKKMMQLRHRYVIQIITDKRAEQVKKTFRQFQYFNKIIQSKLSLKDRQLHLTKHFRTNNDYADLQFYIQRLNSGYLTYRSPRDLSARRNADSQYFSQMNSNQILHLEPSKTRELRSYLYDLLFRQDELFIDGVDEDSDQEIVKQYQNPTPDLKKESTSIISEFNKQTVYENKLQSKLTKKESPSKNLLKKIWYASNADRIVNNPVTEVAVDTIQRVGIHANDIKNAVGIETRNSRQKSSESGKLKRALKNLANKAKQVGNKAAHFYENIQQTTSLKTVLKNVTKCWIKFPNSYKLRDRNVLYKPFIWQQYEIKLIDNMIELTNATEIHRHRKVYVIFQCDVQINFQTYTKLIIKNKIDNNPLEIRLSLQDQNQEITQKYLAIYTYIKQTVKQQQQKLHIVSPIQKKSKVCNKVRVRVHLKGKTNKSGPNGMQKSISTPNSNMIEIPNSKTGQSSLLLLNLPHKQVNNDQKEQFEYKTLRQASSNVKSLSVKMVHSSIQVLVTIEMDSYVDIDFPIIDNFGFIDIFINEIIKEVGGYFPISASKDALYSFHLPVQTIYDYIYNIEMPQVRKREANAKMIQVKHTKINLSLDYKGIGSYKAWSTYNQNDIFEDEEPPEQFNRDEFRMNNNRLKRIIWSIQLYTEKLKDLKNFTFPNLSYLFYIFLALSCLFYDNNNCFFWVLVLLLLVLFYNSPVYNLYIRDLVNILKIQAKKQNLDTFLFKKNKLLQQQYVFPMKKQAKRQFLAEFQLTRKVKRSIYKKYRRLLQVLLQAQIILTKFVSFVQKIKNLFIWYHFKKTRLFFGIIVGLVIGLFILPMRIIMCLIVLRQMLKGSRYHANIQDINRVIVIELIRIILRQNNLGYMQLFFKQHTRTFDFQNAQTKVFYKTCDEVLSQWLQIKIRMSDISKASQNMSQFVMNLSKCKQKYKIKKQICEKYGFSLEWSKTENSMIKFLDVVYGFIVTIPSDKYIMGVKTIHNSKDEDVDEIENVIDRQLLNF